MGGGVDVLAGAQRCNQQGNFVLPAELDILLEPVVGLMHDLVDRERR
jgi:hypothetical protein